MCPLFTINVRVGDGVTLKTPRPKGKLMPARAWLGEPEMFLHEKEHCSYISMDRQLPEGGQVRNLGNGRITNGGWTRNLSCLPLLLMDSSHPICASVCECLCEFITSHAFCGMLRLGTLNVYGLVEWAHTLGQIRLRVRFLAVSDTKIHIPCS